MKNSSFTVINRVRENIECEKLLQKSDSVLCALSGGADSVALLVILKELSAPLGFTVCAAHLNHGIRGQEADRDEAFCDDLCKQLDIPFKSAKVDVPAEAKRYAEGLEECARRLRYAFLNEAAADLGCNKICTAHHADDNIETVLMHMIRGCALGGLTGISPIRGNIVRPLLTVRKHELEKFLSDSGYGHVFDSTNNCLDSTRNFIRHEILPNIYRINPNADRSFYRMCTSISRDESYLTNECDALPGDLDRNQLCKLDTAILSRYIIKRYAEAFLGKDVPHIDNKSVKLIEHALKTDKSTVKYDIPGDITVYIDQTGLTFQSRISLPNPEYRIPLKLGENIISSIGYRILIEQDKKVAQQWQNVYKSSTLSQVNFDKITNGDLIDLHIRNRKASERYVFGKMSRDVRRQLINYKIPQRMRDTLPVLCTKDDIVMVCGLPVADEYKAAKGDKPLYVVFAYDRELLK